MSRPATVALGVLAMLALPAGAAHPGKQLLQLTVAERNDLRDPFFVLVLDRDPNITSLSAIESLIQPDIDNRMVFVVDEHIASSQPGARRAVLAYKGSNAGIRLDPNVMLSVGFSPEGFSDEPSLIEAWGWDESRGRYNYYSLEQVTAQSRRWFFQGTSDDLSLPPAQQGRCLACHRSGPPVMKELKFPWNNWNSPVAFRAAYLSPGEESWPVANELSNRNLEGAEKLEEDLILPSLRRFNQARLVRDRRLDSEGKGLIVDARRILGPLFVPTEFNLATASTESGMHPLSTTIRGKPSSSVRPPDTFFLNYDLIAGNRRIGIEGLGIDEANAFRQDPTFEITPDEYAELVEKQRIGDVVGGDALFAWLTPEPAYSDVHLVDQLMHEGIVPAHFVAAVVAIDLQNPLLSEARKGLLKFVPESFRFAEGTPSADHDLVRQTMQNLEDAAPVPGSAEALLLARLKTGDAVDGLRDDVKALVARLKNELKPGAPQRPSNLRALYDRLLERRRQVSRHPALSLIIESELLLPLPLGE